jgi:hypothetical protein
MNNPGNKPVRVVCPREIVRYYDGARDIISYIGTINTTGNFLLYSIGSYNLYDRPNPKIMVERTGEYIDARY